MQTPAGAGRCRFAGKPPTLNHDFERRVGLWPASFDGDGELYCNQRYGDWPMAVSGFRQDSWRDPAWMLLSVGKAAFASSCIEGHEANKATAYFVRVDAFNENGITGSVCVSL